MILTDEERRVLRKTKAELDDWLDRVSEMKKKVRMKAPFFGDCPCYYCPHPNDTKPGETPVACAVCIHNPDAKIFKLLEEVSPGS